MLRQVHRALCDLIHRESKIIILNVHENASDFENEFVQQITLRESCDPRFESSFPKVRHQLISVDDEQPGTFTAGKKNGTCRKEAIWLAGTIIADSAICTDDSGICCRSDPDSVFADAFGCFNAC